MFPREYRRALQEMAEEEAKKVAENEMINGGVDGDEEDDEEEVINEARGWLMRLGGQRNWKITLYWVIIEAKGRRN